MTRPITTSKQILLDRLNSRTIPVTESGCLLWEGKVSPFGYGIMKIGGRKGKDIVTHRLMWLLVNGEIPQGQVVMHKCDVPLCVNPKHLMLGTSADNARDMHRKGRARFSYGEAHGKSKLNESKVRMIRKLLSENFKQTEIERIIGIDQTTISQIKRGKTWSHVT